MKLLFDLFPVILFFLSFKISEAKIDQTMGIVNRLLGSGIDPMQAPVILATSVAIVASILQVAFVLLRGKKVEVMLWLSLAIVTIFGGLTIWLHNPLFIKWKPTILYWVFASILIYGSMTGKNFIHKLIHRGRVYQPRGCLLVLHGSLGEFQAFRPPWPHARLHARDGFLHREIQPRVS